MYFVRYGDICVRFTGKGWDERKLPEFTSVYDYDDEKKYSLDDLERESRRTDFGGTGRDEDAHGPWGTVPSGPFSAVQRCMDRGGRFLPDHFRPWTVGDGSFRGPWVTVPSGPFSAVQRCMVFFSYFLQFFGDVSFLTHLFLDNEGAGVLGCRGAGEPGAGSTGRVPEAGRVSEVAGDRQGGSSPAASQAAK